MSLTKPSAQTILLIGEQRFQEERIIRERLRRMQAIIHGQADATATVRIPVIGGGHMKVTGPCEFVYEDNSAPQFKDDDK